MTDLDSFLSAPGREDLIRQVRDKIDETGVEYVYFEYVSLTGRVMGKGVPADHWENIARRGVQTWIGGLANVVADRAGNLIGYGPQTHELLALPDPETFCQLPWEKRLGRVFCTVFHMREDKANPGGYMAADSRGNLRRIHAQFQKDHGGLHMRHGCEPEMMWLKRGAKGGFDGGPTKPYAYHIDQFEELAPVFLQVLAYGRAMGLDMTQGDHEDAPGQLELNFMFDEALRTADRLTTYRQICARVAAPGRLEYRSVDSMVNPYLMAAALLKAMDDGIRRELDPGEPEERNIYEAMGAGKKVERLPRNLGESLEALAGDPVIQSALPGDLYRLYNEYKRDEWDRFNATVSDWDVERYLDCLP